MHTGSLFSGFAQEGSSTDRADRHMARSANLLQDVQYKGKKNGKRKRGKGPARPCRVATLYLARQILPLAPPAPILLGHDDAQWANNHS